MGKFQARRDIVQGEAARVYRGLRRLMAASQYQYSRLSGAASSSTYVQARMGPLTPLHRFDTIGLKQADQAHYFCAWSLCICLLAL